MVQFIGASVRLATVAIMGMAGAAAHAADGEYFIRPYIEVGGGGLIDGYQGNGATSGSQNFTSAFQTTVDLDDGTVHSYMRLDGTYQSGQVAGIFGDTIKFNGGAGTSATFSFSFDGTIETGEAVNSSLYTYVFSNLYVFEASAGATWNNFSSHSGALINQSKFVVYNPAVGESLSEYVEDMMSGTISLSGPGEYSVFAALSISAAINSNPGTVIMDFMNTGRFGITADPGVTYSSASGVFLDSTAPTGAVPEPATWAMMIGGFAMAGSALRRQRRRQVLQFA